MALGHNRLPLNLDLIAGGAALVEVFTPYIPPVPKSYAPVDMAPVRSAEAAIRERLKAELIESGAGEKVASLAANAFCAYGFAPGFGLRDMDDRLTAIYAQQALDGWVSAKIAAHRPAQAQKAAA